MTSADIIQQLKRMIAENHFDLQALNEWCQKLGRSHDAQLAIPTLFHILEHFQDEEFGNPGEIVRALEKHYKKGYETELMKSLDRSPTPQTVWMLNRIINDTAHENHLIFLQKMKQIATQAQINTLRALAEEFLENN